LNHPKYSRMERFYVHLFKGKLKLKIIFLELNLTLKVLFLRKQTNRYRPDLCDWNAIENALPEELNEIAFHIFEEEFKIPRVMSADESITLQDIDIKTWLHYLEQVCEIFRGEIPHVKHPKLDYAEFKQKTQTQKNNNMADFTKLHRIAAAKREAANDENGVKKSRDKLPGKSRVQKN